MELTMTNGFCELSHDEMEMVDGGGFWKVASIFCGVVAVATVVAACVVTGGALTAAVPGIIAYTGVASTVGSAGCAIVDGIA